MCLPGIVSLSYLRCCELSPNLALASCSGIPVGIFAPQVPVSFYGIPECEAVEATENNGRVESATLSFLTLQEIPQAHELAFHLTTAAGLHYLIGTKEDIPTVQVTRLTGTPTGSPAGFHVEVRLTALKALIDVAG